MHNELDMLRRALAEGSISKAELQARLTVIIEEAYQRLPVDAAFIADCESLLQTVITGSTDASPSIAVDCWKTLRANTQVPASHWLGWKGRLALVATVCLLLFVLQELTFDRTWVGGRSAYGGSTYIIGTHRMQGGLSANAKETRPDVEYQQLSTANWEELVAFLGYEPPRVDVSDFDLSSYTAYRDDTSSSSCQSYSQLSAGRSLNIQIHDYDDVKTIAFSISQVRPGEYVTLSDGTEVYMAEAAPLGSGQTCYFVIWLDGTRIYHISGTLPQAELLAIADALCRQ